MNRAAPARPRPRRRRRWIRWVAALAVLALATFFLVASRQIVQQSGRDEAQPADVIVVFGAAEYAGRPSPVFKARLDHAYALFRRNLAPIVIVTGGSGDDPRFSEGGVGRDYLISRGIPEHNLIAETQSSNTSREAGRVATIMRVNGLHSCIAVSDRYHMFRIKALLESEGVGVYGSPRPESRAASGWQAAQLVAREAVSYMLWRMHIT
ncbi:MAG TPA: YdcF family protein [Terriglobales bacterium]|nr:YdcF family protein [Terriglobales bacterium]